MEHFDALSDDRLLLRPEPQSFPTEPHAENPANRFVYDKYDWRGFKAEGQVTVILTRGYFTFVGEEDAELLRNRSPFAHVHICPHTKEILNVRAAIKVNGMWMFLHRFLMSAKKVDIVDHVNNLPLDNRRLKNLWSTNSSFNNANRFRGRPLNNGLMRGVEPRGVKYGGKIKFGRTTYRSPEVWETQLPAHEWHLCEFKRLHGLSDLTVKPKRNYPVFPPRVDDMFPAPF